LGPAIGHERAGRIPPLETDGLTAMARIETRQHEHRGDLRGAKPLEPRQLPHRLRNHICYGIAVCFRWDSDAKMRRILLRPYVHLYHSHKIALAKAALLGAARRPAIGGEVSGCIGPLGRNPLFGARRPNYESKSAA